MEDCRKIGHELLDGKLGEASKELLLEERLFGVEASLFFACNGLEAVALPHARDHKRLDNDDQGPNTGGMGAISPNPIITDELLADIVKSTIQPTLQALHDHDASFVGFLSLVLCSPKTDQSSWSTMSVLATPKPKLFCHDSRMESF